MHDSRYDTFWGRLGAHSIDLLIIIPLSLFTACLGGLVYTIAMHATKGQTLGKMACGVIVLRADDEERFGWGRAIWRELAPQIVLFVMIVGSAVAFLLVASPTVEDEDASATALGWVIVLVILSWAVGNVATMAFSHRRRTLVDLLGGTVVMKTAYYEAPASLPPPDADYLGSGLQTPHYAGGILHVPPAPPAPPRPTNW
ncbi:MAG: RDD family protein [Tepidiformaceae bacterium]